MANDRTFKTLVDLFDRSCTAYGSRDLFGTKRGDVWTWTNYASFKTLVEQARGGLAALGVGRGDRVAIVANNRLEWAVLAFATFSLGAAFVPMYEAQNEDDWRFIVSDCQAKVLVTATHALWEKARAAAFPAVNHILCLAADDKEEASYAHLLRQGAASPAPAVTPEPSDLCSLIYTSGTTGKPKGVRLSHGNLAANVTASLAVFDFAATDRSVSFLPWAHCFGQTCELYCLMGIGASMALNTSVDKLLPELAEVQPTILISVPRIYNRIYAAVSKQMATRPPVIQKLFATGLRLSGKQRRGETLSLLERATMLLVDRLIFRKVRARFGGRLKYTVSGGAALARDVAEFIDSLGIVVYEGYGLSETGPVIAANCPGSRRMGSVGHVLPGVRVRIDTLASGEEKQGEIIAYGPNVMLGYYGREEDTKNALAEDGGFRTGDLGYLDEDGYLWITGRIKEQYKLENGKYVAPGPLEEEFKVSLFLSNAMVYGANKPFNVAVLVPDRDAVVKFAADTGLQGSYDELLTHEAVRQRIGQEVDQVNQRFKSFDRVKKFVLIAEDFTTENDMLTPTLKLKRRNVLKQWGEKIEELYVGG